MHETARADEQILRLASSLPDEQRRQIEHALPRARHTMRLLIESGAWPADELPRVLLDESRFIEPEPPFAMLFRELIAADPNIRGRVLDIGCAGALPRAMWILSKVSRQVDGVDPGADVLNHPNLTMRWQGTFEDAPIPESAYDMAYAWNVVEHIADARRFFEKLSRVLRPGGTFWAVTPHAHHPFAVASYALQSAGFKRWIARRTSGVNEYPAYYRLNSPGKIRKAIRGLGLVETTFEYAMAPGWDFYLPRFLRWGARAYSRVLESRFRSLRVILIFGLRRADA